MINFFLRLKTKKTNRKLPDIKHIEQANKVLFSLFTRYGDTIIDLVVIQEFIAKYPNKEYLILCPRQMQPYVGELLPNVESIAVNKRNIFDMIKIDFKLKKWRPDVGFNPWSNGLDSCYFLTYCKYFHCYKDFDKPKIVNHYQIVRKYLFLKQNPWAIQNFSNKSEYKNILICPQSTDVDRSISATQLKQIILDLNSKYSGVSITIAAIDSSYFKPDCDRFFFHKTKQSSQAFINLVKSSELVVCADSAPLHLSLAFKKNVKAFFYTTSPEVVLNTNSRVGIINA
jgi:ADP-heptose:LPS heptosyltransferase